MRKVPKKGFKVELTKVGGMHIFEVARFIIDPVKKTTRCLLIEDHRIGKTSILRRTLAKSKVTCKDPDVYNEETGKLMAFTEAIDQYHLKQMRSAERQYEVHIKNLQRKEDLLLTRFKSYSRNGK